MSNTKYEDFTGRKFGVVTVTHRAPPSVHGAVLWFGVCECGKGRWFRSNNLKKFPPRTHKFCRRGVDGVREQAYECAPLTVGD